MKLFIFIILTLSIPVSCQYSKIDLKGSWIITGTRSYPNDDIFGPVYRGELLKFETEIVYVSHPSVGDELNGKYYFDNDSIIMNRRLLGEIIKFNKDSLIILSSDKINRMLLSPLKEVKHSRESIEKLYKLLLKDSWKMFCDEMGSSYKFQFSDLKWDQKGMNYVIMKQLKYEEQNLKNEFIYTNEWWSLKDFHGIIIFCFSSSKQTKLNYFQITKFSTKEIKGRFYNYNSNKWIKTSLKKVVSTF